MKHCDDYIDDEIAPASLRAFLRRARSPGHGMLDNSPYPRLFANHNGKRVRVAKLDGIQRDARGFFWDTRTAAQSALCVAKAAITAGVERPIPDWAQQALAAGWKAPKGWKP